MGFAYEKLRGLDRDRLMQVIEPVLCAHQLDGVEAIWRTDNRGWVLYLTVERPGSESLGAGITLDDCGELSRDLSTALDVAELISAAYRLEVGSPGLERQLYRVEDYRRFVGQTAKVRCSGLVQGQKTLRGTVVEVTDAPAVVLETDQGAVVVPFTQIEAGQLVLLMGPAKKPGSKSGAKSAKKVSAKASPSTEEHVALGVSDLGSSASPAQARPEKAHPAKATSVAQRAADSDSTQPS
ncbi:MAG: hypothetical protein RJA70_2536 [Pseudomonadota bacterium]|jgi:ribosome maturation factor RimP